MTGCDILKLITFTVPCYNSAAYMRHCIDSLLTAGDEADILLVDDGSTDGTAAIADGYAAEHPECVRVIHQPNSGHGEGVNQGIANAEGLYFMVVDSDDWLDEGALHQLMTRLRGFAQQLTPIDLVVCNYVCERPGGEIGRVVSYKSAMPEGTAFGWKELGRLNVSQFINIHSAIYRTELLRESGLMLPLHSYYVDNLYAYQPLPFVKTLLYLDIDLYRYFIGREDQSITQENLIQRIEQQILVTRLLIDSHDLEAVKKANPRLGKYMYHYLSLLMMVCTIYLWESGTPENIRRADSLWDEIKWSRPALYRRLRYNSFNVCLLPGKYGRKINMAAYRKLRKKYKFY